MVEDLARGADAGGTGVKRKAKRRLTPARREQNRRSQIAYRQREKAKKGQLEQAIESNEQGTGSASNGIEVSGEMGEVPFIAGLVPAKVDQVDLFPTASASSNLPLAPSNPYLPPSLFSALRTSPPPRTLSLESTTVASALMCNALLLGFDLSALFACTTDQEVISPFYNPFASALDDPVKLCAQALSTVPLPPPSLRPTLAQVLIPHHACIDLIPFPAIREKALMLSAALPGRFDLWDLKVDIFKHGALTYWGNRKGQGGFAWDMKNWEAEGWFLSKWRLVLGEKGGLESVL